MTTPTSTTNSPAEQPWDEFDDSEENGDGTDSNNDSDTNWADKAENAAHDAASDLRQLGLGSVADTIDKYAGRLTGPIKDPLTYRVFWGAPSMLQNLENTGQEMLGDALGKLGGVGDALGTVAGRVADQTLDDDSGASTTWSIYTLDMQEWLSRPWACKVTMVAKCVAATTQNAATPLTSLAQGVRNMLPGASVFSSASNASTMKDALLGAAEHMLGNDEPATQYDAAPEQGIPLDPTVFLNSMVSVSFSRRNSATSEPVVIRWVTGVVAEFEDLGDVMPSSTATTGTGDRYVSLTIVPELALLGYRTNCRVYQDMNALDIIRDVLNTANVYAGVTSMLPSVLAKLTDHVHLIPPAQSGGGSGSVSNDDWTQKREMCVQYNETDLDFVHRLLEEEGISYFFEHSKRDERVVLVDDPTKGVYCKTVDGKSVPLMRTSQLFATVKEGVFRFGMRQQLMPNVVATRDYNPDDAQTPRPDGCATAAGDVTNWPTATQPATVVSRDYTLQDGNSSSTATPTQFPQFRYSVPLTYQYGDDGLKTYTAPTQGNPAKILLDSYRAQEEFGSGQSNVTTMQPGKILKFKGYQFYRNTDADKARRHYQTCLVTYAYHHGQVATAAVGTPPPGSIQYKAPVDQTISGMYYYNDFECIMLNRDDSTYPYTARPARVTSRPVIRGVQTATVVDANNHHSDGLSNQVYIDEISRRVKVHFHWDRRGEDLLSKVKSSCWVRVAQGWAGHTDNGNWGAMLFPRAGMEVVVAFVDGNPDRPVIVGCVHNGHRIPPVVLPPTPIVKNGQNHDQPVIKTDSTDSPPIDMTEPLHLARSIIKSQTDSFVDNSHANWLVFDDSNQSELMHLRAQKDFYEDVHHDHVVQVGRDPKVYPEPDNYPDPVLQVNAVAGNQVEQIANKKVLTVGGNRVKTVYGTESATFGERRCTVGDPAAATAAANAAQASSDPPANNANSSASTSGSSNQSMEDLTVNGDRTETVDGWELISIGKEMTDPTAMAKVTRTVTILGDQNVTIQKGPNDGNNGDDVLHVANKVDPPDPSKPAKQDVIIGKLTLSAAGGMNMQSGDASGAGNAGINTDPDGSVNVHSDTDIKFDANGTVEIKTDNNDVQLECDKAINIAAKTTSAIAFVDDSPGGGGLSNPTLAITGSGTGSGDIKGVRLSVNDGKTKIEITTDGITLTVTGDPDSSVMKISSSGIQLSGNWLRMRAATTITMAGAINFKPGS